MIHLYFKTTISKQIAEVTSAFKDCRHIDISNISKLKDDNVYLVEIDKAEKSILLDIKKLLLDKKENLIYFFTNDAHSLILFQLASLLSVKTIFTKKHDVPKIISTITKEITLFKNIKIDENIAKTVVNDCSFMIFNKDKLTFASKKIYDDFKCNNLADVTSKICSQLQLKNLLANDISLKDNLTLSSQKQKYNIKSKTSNFSNETFIYIEKIIKDKDSDSSEIGFIKNHIYFIEILKEKVLEKSISQSLLGITTIQIENMSNLKEDWSEYDIEMAIRDLLLEVEIKLKNHTLLAQYDNEFYVILFTNLDFPTLTEQANKLHTYIKSYTSKQKIKPIIGLYTFEVNDLQLNTILKTISKISTESITQQELETQKIHRVMNVDEDLDEGRSIDIFLQTTFTNKVPIKLLNIYKGLCINTSSVIAKKTEQEIYVTYAQLQGTVMHFEKSTVIQSSGFSHDIVADVTYIDFNKKFAKLKNFRFIQGSANARKYSRVTCAQRTPITISHGGGTLSGEILDISITSIAIKTRLYQRIASLKADTVTLGFTLPIESSEDGYIKLSPKAKVIFTICDKEFCKIVVNLEEDTTTESILMEYVYNRQKEVILELRKQTTMLK